eukprot:UN30899
MYAVLAQFIRTKNRDDHNTDSVKRENLRIPVQNLCQTILPRIDVSRDGRIDRDEFEKLADYIADEYSKLHGRRGWDGQGGNGEFGLASVANEVFKTVKQINLEDHLKPYKGITYYDNQILSYESASFMYLGVWQSTRGTIFASKTVWMKLFFLTCLFIGFIFLRV